MDPNMLAQMTQPQGGQPMAPPPMGIDPSMMGGMGMGMPGMGEPTQGSQQAVLQGMDPAAKPEMPQEVQAHDALTAAIKAVNNYIKLVSTYDQANAKAARMVLAVLGEMFKTAEFDTEQTMAPPVM